MSSWTKATWVHPNRKKAQTGSWKYVWSKDVFLIRLDSKDPVTGLTRVFESNQDHPEWGGYKRLKDESN